MNSSIFFLISSISSGVRFTQALVFPFSSFSLIISISSYLRRLVFKYPCLDFWIWIIVCCARTVFACDADADTSSWIISSKYRFTQNHDFSFSYCQVWPVARCQLAPCRCIIIKHTKHAVKGLQVWCVGFYCWSLSQG